VEQQKLGLKLNNANLQDSITLQELLQRRKGADQAATLEWLAEGQQQLLQQRLELESFRKDIPTEAIQNSLELINRMYF
jgi:hypothetical protein